MDEQRTAMSEFAIVSLVLGIISFLNFANMEKAFAAMIFGILALRRMKTNEQLKGRGMAVAGIILGSAALILIVVLLVKFLPEIREWVKSHGK